VKKSRSEKKQIFDTWGKVLVGSIPAAVLGFLLDDLLDIYLYNFVVVAVALVVYGISFIFVEKSRAESKNNILSIETMSYVDALKIGAFQSLSLVPGTSRSGSTILGGMLIGVSREASAEFSFFMAIPVMLGASALKIVKFMLAGFVVTKDEILLLSVGMIVSFIVSIFVIRFLMDYVKRHDFSLFGYYRILLGIAVLIYFLVKCSRGGI
jgi:undecaprenyl-diphosphatase